MSPTPSTILMNDDNIPLRLTQLETEMRSLTTQHRELTLCLRDLVVHMDTYTKTLLDIVSGRIPEGYVTLKDHRKIVWGLVGAFTAAIVVILGAKELVTYMHQIS